MKLEDVRAIVTGAASGIGRCCCLALARAGAQVAAGDVQAAGLQSLEAEARDLPGRVTALPLDVTQETAVKAFVAEAARRIGSVNTLVNSAGVLRDGWLVSRDAEGFARKLPTAQWRSVLDVNLTGPYLLAREVVAQMVEGGVRPGLVVNISSITRAGNPGQSAYAASKAALDALTRTWALELAPLGVRAAGIAPGLTDTPMAAQVPEAARQEMLAKIPLGRMGRPEEIWLALKFIVECDYFTGRVIDVDGGANF